MAFVIFMSVSKPNICYFYAACLPVYHLTFECTTKYLFALFLGHVICSDKSITIPNCFRVGCIGDIYEDDIRALTNSIRQVCFDMRIDLPLAPPVY